MPRVVVTDYTFGPLDVERTTLEPLGCRVEAAQCRTEDEVLAQVREADYVLTQFAPVGPRAIAAMDRARLIVRYGIGVDNVDLAAAAEHGIPVYNVPDYCIDEVADHTLALILALTRQVVTLTVGIRAGRWGAAPPTEAFHALRDMTVGVVGCGRIGREVVRRLTPFKARIVVYDPLLSSQDAAVLGVEAVSLDNLFAQSDLVTLHLPSTAQTRGLIDAATIAAMKDGVLLVNVSRGTLVNSSDLIAALQSGKIGGAALDVFDPEPIPNDSPLLTMDNVVVTSHIASASVRAAHLLRSRVAETVVKAMQGEALPTSVNGVLAPRAAVQETGASTTPSDAARTR